MLVNDDGTSTDQFFPSSAVDQMTGDLVVSWYDPRNDAAGIKTQYFAAVSSDAATR